MMTTSAKDEARDTFAGPIDDSGKILNQLSARVEADPKRWRDSIFDAIRRWSLPYEVIADEPHAYFIGGEAFNWRRLAERLAWHISFLMPEELESDMSDWLEDDHMFGRLKEHDFRRVLGHEKWRGYLNYFYGVTLERCLVINTGWRLADRKYANGYQITDDMLDEAYEDLYGKPEDVLWAAFMDDTKLKLEPNAYRSIATDDEFTYWLFKKRIGASEYALVAHDVKHGLETLSAITAAEVRRKHWMTFLDYSELLEFKLSKRDVKPSPPRVTPRFGRKRLKVNHA